MTTRARICAHEQVEAAFDDVFEALPTLPALVGAQAPGAKPRSDFRHRDMARLPVHVEGHDASLLVFRLVGGRQAPITEIAVVTTVEGGAELPASAGRRFIEDLTRALESELRAESGQRPTTATGSAHRSARLLKTTGSVLHGARRPSSDEATMSHPQRAYVPASGLHRIERRFNALEVNLFEAERLL